MKNKSFIPFNKATVLLFCFLFAASCAVNPVTGKKELMLLSESQEKALGLESDPGIIANYGLYDDQKMQSFINEKGKQMGKISHRPDLDYQFRILDSPVVNAFAVPGGYVYFTRGIMAHFNNEAEFAGVLGHEIGHVTARHSASQYSKQILAQIGLVAGMVVSEDFRQFANVAQTGVGLLFLKFGRDDESQSDELGVEYSTKIGYDAHEMADFFQTLKRLSDKSGQQIPTFMSTHPDPADRYNKVHQGAENWQNKPEYRGKNLKVNRESYLQMIDGLIYGEDPRQGYVENNNFYHPVMLFQYPVPQNWQLVNTPAQVQMAPKDGKAVMILTLAGEKSLQEAAQATIQQYKLTPVSSENTRVGGFPALTTIADLLPDQQQQQQQQSTQASQITRIRAYYIEYNGMIYKFLGVSAKPDFNTYDRYFTRTMEGFRKLTDQSKINVKPEKVMIKEVKSTGTLATALRAHGVASDRLTELAILNGMKTSDQVTKGTLIKVVGK